MQQQQRLGFRGWRRQFATLPAAFLHSLTPPPPPPASLLQSGSSRALCSSGAGGAGLLAPTRALRGRKEGHIRSMHDSVELMASLSLRDAMEGTTQLDLSLFNDPSGGLSAGPVEELTATDLEMQVRVLLSTYSKDIFYLLYTPFVDVVALVESEGLTPAPALGFRPESEMVKWFTDGATTLKDPTFTARHMGPQRWAAFCNVLQSFYVPIEEVMPLTRVVRAHHLREDIYVPFLRQLSMSLADPDKRRETVATLPGLVLGLANGRAPAVLALPSEQGQRALLIAELFLGAAQETGNTDLAFLGVQLLRANDIATPFAFQKQLTNVFSASSRIQTDWLTRSTGQLVEVYPKWLDYFKTVRQDNVRALERLQAERDTAGGDGEAGAKPTSSSLATSLPTETNETCEETEGEETGQQQQQQHVYFTSKLREDVERLSTLERNIEDSIWAKAPLLTTPAQRKRHVGTSARTKASKDQEEDLVAAGEEVRVRSLKSDEVNAGPKAREKSAPRRKRKETNSRDTSTIEQSDAPLEDEISF